MASTARDPPEQRFREYVDRLAQTLGHRDRHEPLRAYLTGLCLPGDRKSVEPMAARIDPRHVRARHQSMHHLVANAAWEDTAVLRIARDVVLTELDRHGPVAAWLVDDTAYPKKGHHSVGVAHQYCGALGKQANCQVAVTVTLVNEAVSVPAAQQLYLPAAWARDRTRRRTAGIPPNGRLPSQVADCPGPDPHPARRERPPSPGGGGCGLRGRPRVPAGAHRAWDPLRPRRSGGHPSLAARGDPAAATASAPARSPAASLAGPHRPAPRGALHAGRASAVRGLVYADVA
jgi:DDE superfamily endonuclease